MNDHVYSNKFEVEYDTHRACLQIWHPNVKAEGLRAIEISKATLSEMSFAEASRFVGERILLSIPAMREQFKDYLWGDDGVTPPKKA